MSKISWPNGKKFAFSIFDDTDNATVANCKPVYDYLFEKKVLSTKSVWCFPPRGNYAGESLQERHYLEWIRSLMSQGFEIGLHGVGDGRFTRAEIEAGLRLFKECLGIMPRVHTNHVSNTDNLYWGGQRFEWPISTLYQLAIRLGFKRRVLNEDDFVSWGDLAREYITYVRNHTFLNINTLRSDPCMPWHDEKKPDVKFWFSSADGHNLQIFTDLLSSKNLDRLEREGGLCIVYTHFASGFVGQGDGLDLNFRSRIDDLAARDGWFAPVGEILDFLRDHHRSASTVSYAYRLRLNWIWMFQRLAKLARYGI